MGRVNTDAMRCDMIWHLVTIRSSGGMERFILISFLSRRAKVKCGRGGRNFRSPNVGIGKWKATPPAKVVLPIKSLAYEKEPHFER